MFWLRNRKNDFLVHTLIWRPDCEVWIEKSVPRITDWHHEASPVMTNGDRKGQLYLSHLHKNNGFYLSHELVRVCKIELSHMGKDNRYLYLVCKKSTVGLCQSVPSVLAIYISLYLISGQLQVFSAFM